MTSETTKAKAPTKADLQDQIKELLAEKTARESEPAQEDEGDKVFIRCVCSNVHLGNGTVLRATKNSKGNWKDGDSAEVSVSLGKILVGNESCEYV